jgi:glucokinase
MMRRGRETRKPIALGIDIGGTYIKTIALDAWGRVCYRKLSKSIVERGPTAVLSDVTRIVELATSETRKKGYRISGVGVCICGPVDPELGRMIQSPILPGWKNVPVKEVLTRSTGQSIVVENDANAAVLGEWWMGAGRRMPIVAGLTLGTGVGGGLVVDGEIYRGSSGFGGEFGHISVADAPSCPCGGVGCLGRVASATATLQRFRERRRANRPEVTDMRELNRLSRGGDRVARASLAESTTYIANAIVTLLNCLNPDVFVLAGGMATSVTGLVAGVRKHVRTATFPAVYRTARIVRATLGLESGCFGVAYRTFETGGQ